MAETGNEPVAVIGLGRFGSTLALELTRRGTEVLAVDSSPKLVQNLAGRLTQVVTADATDIDALHELGVPDFYRAVVGIGTDIESSILITSMLAEVGVDDIWAKAITNQHGRILRRVGAGHVVFPEQDMGQRIAHLVSGQVLDYMQVDDDFAIAKMTPPQEIVSVPLGETRVRAKHGITIVAVKAGEDTFTYADHTTTLMYGDTILATGRVRDLDRFVRLP